MFSPSAQLLRVLRAGLSSRALCPSDRAKHAASTYHTIPTPTRSCRNIKGFSTAPRFFRDRATRPPRSRDRGPMSQEDTQTDFGAMNILGNTKPPATSIDACVTDGFHLDNGIKTSGGGGIILVGGEAFTWKPWAASSLQGPSGMLNKQGTLDIGEPEGSAWGLLELLWPKPDLLILGTGDKVWPLSKETRAIVNGLGVKIDVMDTGNASAAYNLLATERGTDTVAAALLPMGWKGR